MDFSQFNPYRDLLKLVRSSSWRTHAKSSNDFLLEILSPVPRFSPCFFPFFSSFLLGTQFLLAPASRTRLFHTFPLIHRGGQGGLEGGEEITRGSQPRWRLPRDLSEVENLARFFLRRRFTSPWDQAWISYSREIVRGSNADLKCPRSLSWRGTRTGKI